MKQFGKIFFVGGVGLLLAGTGFAQAPPGPIAPVASQRSTNEPPPPPGEEETDLTALRRGFMTLTPLNYNMTHAAKLAEMQRWKMSLD